MSYPMARSGMQKRKANVHRQLGQTRRSINCLSSEFCGASSRHKPVEFVQPIDGSRNRS